MNKQPIRTARSVVFAGLMALGLTATENANGVAATPAYSIASLGTLNGGMSSRGNDINASGQVTGVASTPSGEARAFLWTPLTPGAAAGTMHDLGTLGGTFSTALGVNDSGQVVGYSWLTDNPADGYHAFLWSPEAPGGDRGTLRDLGTLGGTFSVANDINAHGQVTGLSFRTGDRATSAFLWTPTSANSDQGAMRDLGTLGGPSSEGTAVNNVGQVTGYAYKDDQNYYPFLYDSTRDEMQVLDDFTGTGESINAQGQITGRGYFYDGPVVGEPYLWSPTTPEVADGTSRRLGTLGGAWAVGQDINASGQVVGFSFTEMTAPVEHAFLYTNDKGLVDLNSLIDPQAGWELAVATGINDSGQITGVGHIDGQQRAFLLTPTVPEPAGIVLLTLAAPPLVRRRAAHQPRMAGKEIQ